MTNPQGFYAECHICGDIQSDKHYDETLDQVVCKDREKCNERWTQILDDVK